MSGKAEGSCEHLAEKVDAVSRVNAFAQAIAAHGELSHVLAETVSRIRQICAADAASIWLIDPTSGELSVQSSVGQDGRAAGPAAEELARRVAATAIPLSTEAEGAPTASILAVPLLVGGDVLGVAEAVCERSLPAAELQRLSLVAPHVAIAIHHGRVMGELRRTRAEALEANHRLEEKVQERTRQIAKAKREWELTFDAISEPMVLQDGFTVRRANLAYARYAGRPVQALNGRRCHELLANRSTPCPGCPLVAAASGPCAAELPLGERLFDVSSFPVDEGRSRVVRYRDVTEVRALEARLRESERLAAVGQLASGAAHEINNPLGFLSSNLQSLKVQLRELAAALPRGSTPEVESLIGECEEMVVESLEGTHRVAAIVRGLREMSRLEIGGGARTRLSDSVDRAVHAELAGDPRVTVDVPEDLVVLVDPLKLDQALVHILRNARQAIQSDGHIEVRGWREGESVALRIKDDGDGIAPEHVGRVFEPFFTTRRIGSGVGLGLTAAWGIVTRFGGRIEVDSRPGEGASFTIRLPEADPSDEAAAARTEADHVPDP